MSERVSTLARARKVARQHNFAECGPDTLNGRFLRQFWHPVGISADLAPGRPRPVKIMNELYTLYRGETGTPHIVAHRCPHRGTQLSGGFVEGDEIRCIYHGWKFDGSSGRCTEMPAETPQFAAKVRIPSYPTGEHLGLIWGYFGEGEAPPFPPVPGFMEEGQIEVRSDMMPCNYFQTFENDFDPYHAVWTHSHNNPHNFFREMLVVDGQPPAQETDWGILEVMNLNMDPNPVIAVFLPATIRTLIPAPLGLYEPGLCALNRDTYLIHVPIDDHHTITYATQSVRIPKGMEEKYAAKHAAYDQSVQSRPPCELGQAILDGKLNFDDVAGHPMMVVIEDYVAQVGQGAIADREAEWLGRSDANIIQLRKIVARELDALAENRPTKRWTTLESTPDELQQQKETYRERGLY